jgi:catechol 2,3-dioxygenase-like lactoylglutathione lyase family enzyme
MIGYVTLGTNDMQASAKFYDELLAEIGAKRFMEANTFIAGRLHQTNPVLPSINLLTVKLQQSAMV